jgi:hypothetical protein
MILQSLGGFARVFAAHFSGGRSARSLDLGVFIPTSLSYREVAAGMPQHPVTLYALLHRKGFCIEALTDRS